MDIRTWLASTSDDFANSMIPSARLDAEIILAHSLNKPRAWLHAHDDEKIDPRRLDIANARARLRLDHVPIAYIVGHKEFYGRRFYVNTNTLIPRPETETLIDLVKQYLPPDAKQLVDVGTGCGAIGITIKLEMPKINVTITDVSKYALNVASKNAQSLDANVKITQGNLLDNYLLKADVIVANLPYVDRDWTVSNDTESEPNIALYADLNGLKLIKELIVQSTKCMSASGLLILEADPRQHSSIIDYARQYQFSHLETRGFGLAFTYQSL